MDRTPSWQIENAS